MDVTLILNGTDYSSKLLSFRVRWEVTYGRVVTALNKREYSALGHKRPIIDFSLYPMTDEESAALYSDMSKFEFSAVFTDPYSNADITRVVRLVSDLESIFALRSVDGKRRYKGGSIQLRGVG